jgi:hypothetical protein
MERQGIGNVARFLRVQPEAELENGGKPPVQLPLSSVATWITRIFAIFARFFSPVRPAIAIESIAIVVIRRTRRLSPADKDRQISISARCGSSRAEKKSSVPARLGQKSSVPARLGQKSSVPARLGQKSSVPARREQNSSVPTGHFLRQGAWSLGTSIDFISRTGRQDLQRAATCGLTLDSKNILIAFRYPSCAFIH